MREPERERSAPERVPSPSPQCLPRLHLSPRPIMNTTKKLLRSVLIKIQSNVFDKRAHCRITNQTLKMTKEVISMSLRRAAALRKSRRLLKSKKRRPGRWSVCLSRRPNPFRPCPGTAVRNNNSSSSIRNHP